MSKSKMEIAKESFDEDFCLYLEYYLSGMFPNSNEKELRNFWCDGILIPDKEKELTKKHVNDTRKIETEAWIAHGSRQQWLYKMIIRLGKYSLGRYAKESSLKDCIPDSDVAEWVILDTENKIIELLLK